MKLNLLFYKANNLLVNIDLVSGGYFFPNIELAITKTSKHIINTIKKEFSVDVGHYEEIPMPGKDNNMLFIPEWEGYFTANNDSVRNKWVNINEFQNIHVNHIRKYFVDIIDRKNETIGIASTDEAKKYKLRHRAISKDGKVHAFLLGEDIDNAMERLKLKKKDYRIVDEHDHSDDAGNYYLYEIEKK